jgi:general secretion pathway protein N
VKKRWLLYAVFGLVFYLLFLIIEMPASWFAWGLNYYTHNTVRLDPLSGSLWHGKGRLVIYYPQTTVPHDFGQTEWSINPFWLFAGHVQMNWQCSTQNARLNTTIRLSSGKIELLDTDVSFPAEAAGTFFPAAALISPQGNVSLRINKLTLDDNGMTEGGEIQWLSAGSAFSAVQPLGDYRLEIMGAGRTANLKLSTIRGALELSGQGKWEVTTGQIRLNGYATPRERAAELEPLLKLSGNDQGNGRRDLAINMSVPMFRLQGN